VAQGDGAAVGAHRHAGGFSARHRCLLAQMSVERVARMSGSSRLYLTCTSPGR
jgi:hypothetical protein